MKVLREALPLIHPEMGRQEAKALRPGTKRTAGTRKENIIHELWGETNQYWTQSFVKVIRTGTLSILGAWRGRLVRSLRGPEPGGWGPGVL